jgi:hypothetical protein
MSEVFIPDNPPERTYGCPGCGKGVKGFRVGNSSSYLIMDATDEKHQHDCGYKGNIPIKLLGYQPPKVKKNDPQHTPESSPPSQPVVSPDVSQKG